MENYKKPPKPPKPPKPKKHHKDPWRGFPVFPQYPQRYPHTHYFKHGDFQEWISTECSILKQWDMALTHLLALATEEYSADNLELILELDKLIKKLQGFIDELTARWKLYDDAIDAYHDEVYNAFWYVIELADKIKEMIAMLAPLFKALFECIETVLKNHDNDIRAIIEYIYDLVENAADQDGVTSLIDNSCFNVYYFNGFYNDASGTDYMKYTPYVTQTRKTFKNSDYTQYNDTFNIRFTPNYKLGQDCTIVKDDENSQAFTFRHGNSYTDVPKSWICAIQFFHDNDPKGGNVYTSSEFNSAEQIGNNTWNTTPKSQRGSWGVGVTPNMVSTLNPSSGTTYNHVLLLSAASINDGYNTQYYPWYDGLSFGALDIQINANYTCTIYND